MYKWNLSCRNEPLTFDCKPGTLQANNRLPKELKQGQRTEYKSLSYPDKSFICATNNRKYYVDTTESTGRYLTDALGLYSSGNSAFESREQSQDIQSLNSGIDGAKQFLAQSGILGTTNFRSSCDLIRKTSSIHIDATLRDQIRKKSLCLRSRIGIEKNIPKSYDELITSLQHEVDTLKGIIGHGETKIITLRTEIGKLKRALQEIIHVQMLASSNASDVGLSSRKGTTICLFFFANLEAGRAKIEMKDIHTLFSYGQ
ncbi:uncharacterized protein LOC117902956 [Drosophila subobscura]|uniref:uncharacterized protein LOC117902956 n=1 Tax=Drosophila subobscura TaxID=7241 RepID=UPI00155B3B20|nr:uncharacterized protein LOC117902956 [Drosophila subobscura]XP_034670485.1 uncharacterized protein LOC117902956 [Drosophila subobscura]